VTPVPDHFAPDLAGGVAEPGRFPAPYVAADAGFPVDPYELQPVRRREVPFSRLVLAMGVGFLVLCGYLTDHAKTKLHTHREAEGTVVDFHSVQTTRGARVYPIVAYQVDGQTYRVRAHSSMGLFSRTYQLGDTIPVLYPPNEPDNGSLNTFADMWLGPIITGALGLSILGLWFCARRSARAQRFA
jgi:hypothetical protein